MAYTTPDHITRQLQSIAKGLLQEMEEKDELIARRRQDALLLGRFIRVIRVSILNSRYDGVIGEPNNSWSLSV